MGKLFEIAQNEPIFGMWELRDIDLVGLAPIK